MKLAAHAHLLEYGMEYIQWFLAYIIIMMEIINFMIHICSTIRTIYTQ